MIARRGFTLIELLVVISIVAVLAGLLFAGFSRARESGRRTQCQSNLRQIALAMQQYVQDNDGRFPMERYNQNENTPQWVTIRWNRAISPYLKTSQVYRCPDFPPDAPTRFPNRPEDDGFDIVDYGFNYARLNDWSPPYGVKLKGTAEATLATPATIFLNGEQAWSFADGVVHGSWHSGGGNYSFVDGHVKWLTPEQFAETECKNGPLPPPFNN